MQQKQENRLIRRLCLFGAPASVLSFRPLLGPCLPPSVPTLALNSWAQSSSALGQGYAVPEEGQALLIRPA